jgi:hypothetical protein
MPPASIAKKFSSNPESRVWPFLTSWGGTAALPVWRHVQLDLALLALDCFLARAVARVAAGVPMPPVVGVAQVRVQFRFQAALNDRLGQLLEQPVLGQHILGITVLLQQFINQFASHTHGFLLLNSQLVGFCHFHKLLYSLIRGRQCADSKVLFVNASCLVLLIFLCPSALLNTTPRRGNAFGKVSVREPLLAACPVDWH